MLLPLGRVFDVLRGPDQFLLDKKESDEQGNTGRGHWQGDTGWATREGQGDMWRAAKVGKHGDDNKGSVKATRKGEQKQSDMGKAKGGQVEACKYALANSSSRY